MRRCQHLPPRPLLHRYVAVCFVEYHAKSLHRCSQGKVHLTFTNIAGACCMRRPWHKCRWWSYSRAARPWTGFACIWQCEGTPEEAPQSS